MTFLRYSTCGLRNMMMMLMERAREKLIGVGVDFGDPVQSWIDINPSFELLLSYDLASSGDWSGRRRRLRMNDSKYAGLPGIAFDQPDVYETSALPEVDQMYYDETEMSDAVDTIVVKADEAAKVFRGKNVRADDADFSDAIKPPSINKGYVAWSGELESEGSGASESVSQRLSRLQREASELHDVINETEKSAQADDHKALMEANVRLQRQLKELQGKLEEREDVGDEGVQKLVKLIEGFNNCKVNKPLSDKELANKEANVLNYELFLRGDQGRRAEEQRAVSGLDNRLRMLEQSVGVDNELMASLRLETNTKTLLDAASVLCNRSRLLDPSYLDHVEGRLAALLQRLNAIAEKRGELEEAEKSSKIAQIFHTVNKVEGMKHTMPQIVDRFAALDALHQQALNFNTNLTGLDEMQQRLKSTLDSNKELLVEVREKMADLTKNTKENFDQLEKRIQALNG